MTLIEYLDKEGLNYAAFAHRLGVNPSTVHRWAREKRKPDLFSLIKIERSTKGLVRPKDFASEAAE